MEGGDEPARWLSREAQAFQVNLIEGGHDQVVAFLNDLTYGDATTEGLQTTRAAWRAKAEEMKQRRLPRR